MATRVAQQAGLKLGLIWATAKLPARRMRIVFMVTLNNVLGCTKGLDNFWGAFQAHCLDKGCVHVRYICLCRSLMTWT